MTKVVVAEDDADIARLVAIKLRTAGHEVTIAENGVLALEACERERPGLLILDACMPVLDGWTVLAKLRQDERFQRLPIVILTAQGQERDRIRGRAGGAQDYIVKPFAIAELVPRLSRWLSGEIDDRTPPPMPLPDRGEKPVPSAEAASERAPSAAPPPPPPAASPSGKPELIF